MQLRTGMWVADPDGRIGVYTTARRLVDPMNPQLGFREYPELHLTNGAGETTLVVPLEEVSAQGLRIARAAELPAPRVGHLSAEQLAAFGYE